MICPTFCSVLLYALNMYKDCFDKTICDCELRKTSWVLCPQSYLLQEFVQFPEIDLKARKNGRECEFASSLQTLCFYSYVISFMKAAACLHQVNDFVGRTELFYAQKKRHYKCQCLKSEVKFKQGKCHQFEIA